MNYRFQCKDCSKSFAVYRELRNHCQRKHRKRLPCPRCSHTFKELNTFKEHLRAEHFYFMDVREFEQHFENHRRLLQPGSTVASHLDAFQYQDAAHSSESDCNSLWAQQGSAPSSTHVSPSSAPIASTSQPQIPGMPEQFLFNYPGLFIASQQDIGMIQPSIPALQSSSASEHDDTAGRVLDIPPSSNIIYDDRPFDPPRDSELIYLPASTSQQINPTPGTSSEFPHSAPGTSSDQQQEQESFPLNHGNYFGPNR